MVSAHQATFGRFHEHHHNTLYTILMVITAFLFYISAYFTRRSGDSSLGVGVAVAALVSRIWRHDESRPRSTITTLLVVVWALRLAYFMNKRGPVMVGRTPAEHESWFPRVLFATAAVLPVALVNAVGTDPGWPTRTERVYVVCAVLAILLESVADKQKARWHAVHKADRPSREDTEPPVCADGLWRLSRHPNHFFSIMFHFSVYALVRRHVPAYAAAGPIFVGIVLIALDGGAATIERTRNFQYSFYSSYETYRRLTSPFLPMPRAVWSSIPEGYQSCCFCELWTYKRCEV